MSKPFSQAAENNKQPILDIVQDVFLPGQSILEIGSGTGQHGVHFSQVLGDLSWQPSDLLENLAGIDMWRNEVQLKNLLPAMRLDVSIDPLPEGFDCIYTANTIHIMPWEVVESLFSKAGRILPSMGFMVIYGPFKYRGAFTTSSNSNFDLWLKERAKYQGIRDFEGVLACAQDANFNLCRDVAMPANNQLLIFQKT